MMSREHYTGEGQASERLEYKKWEETLRTDTTTLEKPISKLVNVIIKGCLN